MTETLTESPVESLVPEDRDTPIRIASYLEGAATEYMRTRPAIQFPEVTLEVERVVRDDEGSYTWRKTGHVVSKLQTLDKTVRPGQIRGRFMDETVEPFLQAIAGTEAEPRRDADVKQALAAWCESVNADHEVCRLVSRAWMLFKAANVGIEALPSSELQL